MSARLRPRLGFLGVGWIGRHRMEAILRSEVAEIAAVADPDENAMDAALALVPSARRASTLDELLASGLDGVVIATPSAQHTDETVRALEHGVAVFCQKPLGRSGDETARAVEAARRANRLLGIDFSYRATAAVRAIAPVVRHELGHVYAADLVFHNAYGPDKPWFFDPALSGGGCLIDLGIHLIDLALWMLDFPKVERASGRLFAKGHPVRDPAREVEDHAIATLDLERGRTLRVACSWHLAAGRDAVIEASFHGTQGGAALRNVNGSFYDFTAERYSGTATTLLCEPPDTWGGRMAVEWATRLAAGKGFDASVESAVDVARVIDRVRGVSAA